MPPRIARASVKVATTAPKKAKNKNKKRALNAYASAARQIPEGRINRNRLGEDLDDGPKRKRARGDDDDEDDLNEDDDEDGPQRKKVATRGIANTHDDLEHGSDSSGNEWTMGGLDEDHEDSDLDSDEAFGESDEERFQSFTFRGSSKKGGKAKRKQVIGQKSLDLDESDDEIDDGDSQDDEGETFGDDGVDLATMLDDDDEDMVANAPKNAEESGSGSEEDDEDSASEDEDEDEDLDDDDDDSADEEAVARNMDRISGLDPLSRSSAQRPEGITTVDDFMDSSIAPLAPLKSKKKKKTEITPLAARLPKRQQDRLDREVASQKAKEQLNRWQDTVKRNRREEFLAFPLQDPTDQSGITGKEKFLPAAQQAPQNELEASIQRIMQDSGLASANKPEGEGAAEQEQALLKAEELATNKLPVEEVLRRRAELRKTRELLFREEIKAKRIAKIKSKSYRRVHRKERERLAEQERQAMEGLGGQVMDEDEKEKQDRRRAEARMGTKHKDSKWAKSLKATGRAVWDEGARDGVVEQARREEELKKRIEGRDVSDSDSEGSLSPSDDESEGDDVFKLRKLESEDGGKEKKGLAGMKFMRDAEERKQKANNEDVARLRKELAIENGEVGESDEGEESLGRALFGPKSTNSKPEPKEQRLEFEAPDHSADEDDERHDEEDEVKIVTEKPKPKAKTAIPQTETTTASGPKAEGWLRDIDEDEKPKTKNSWLQTSKGTSKKAAVSSDDLNILKPASSSTPAKPAKASAPKSGTTAKDTLSANTNGWTTIPHPNAPSDAEEEENGEQSNPMLTVAEQKLSLQQRAFAGDDVIAAFQQEKEDQAASEDEKEISTHLPGWGSWAGDGLSKSIRKANARAKHNPLFKTKLGLGGVKPEDRKDRNMDRVIISQKGEEGVVRKGKKYLASQLPHEFQTREQYERSRRMPVGPEWTTKEVHQRMTRPRVVVKKGVNVEALSRPVI